MPPVTRATRRPWARASGASTSATCSASSRVGTSTTPRGWVDDRAPAVSRTIIGSPKARVLPEPVRARPRTSRPLSASGIVSAWIGKGVVMPAAPRFSTSVAGRPRAAKPPSSRVVGGAGGVAAAAGSAQVIWSDDDSWTGRSSRRAGRAERPALRRGGRPRSDRSSADQRRLREPSLRVFLCRCSGRASTGAQGVTVDPEIDMVAELTSGRGCGSLVGRSIGQKVSTGPERLASAPSSARGGPTTQRRRGRSSLRDHRCQTERSGERPGSAASAPLYVGTRTLT